MSRNKFNLRNPEDSTALIKLMVDKELEKYGKTYEDIINKPRTKIDGEIVYWYTQYEFNTREEYTNWKKFCIDLLKTKVTPKMNKHEIERTFSHIDLSFGLIQKYAS